MTSKNPSLRQILHTLELPMILTDLSTFYKVSIWQCSGLALLITIAANLSFVTSSALKGLAPSFARHGSTKNTFKPAYSLKVPL